MPESQSNKNVNEGSSVLITGGSGLIGRYLTSLLLTEGYKVSHLSRNSNQFGRIRVYRWDPEKKFVDPEIFDGIDYIIHLAGANIGEKRWTKKRKDEITSSRIDSAKLLYDTVSTNHIKIKAFISASAIGYYGSRYTEDIYREKDPPSEDFLGTTCRLWEEAADHFTRINVRTVKIRTGVVIEKSDSALSKLLIPARVGIYPRLGSGRQYMPWIHIEDLCNIYIKAIRDKRMEGAFNAVAPQHVTQTEFMRSLAKAMNRTFFNPPVPSLLLRVFLGKMSEVILGGSRVSSEKIEVAGYNFLYKKLDEAIANVLTQ